MANTVNGFVVIQVGTGMFTLTPADVKNAGASFDPKAALANLQVQYLSNGLDDAVEIGTLGSAGGAAKTAGQLIEDAFGFTGTNTLASEGNDPLTHFNQAFDSISTAFGISSASIAAFKTAIAGIVVKITQITIDVPGKTFTFGIGLDFSSLDSINPFPIKLKALSVTFTHTKT